MTIPIALYKQNDKHHKSKKFLEEKEEAEKQLALGTKNLVQPSILKDDKIAINKWKQLVRLYTGFDFVTSADVDAIAQYCLCFSELDYLILQKRSTIKFLEEEGSTNFKILQVIGNLNLEVLINTKRDKLSKLADKIFLTPTSRIKSVAQPKPDKKDPLNAAGFGDI